MKEKLYDPVFTKEEIQSKLKEKHHLIPYNRFYWWRRYKHSNNNLSKYKPLLQRIQNGDFDMPPYFYDAMISENDIQEKWENSRNHDEFINDAKTDMERKRRLLEDHEKFEREQLHNLQRAFQSYFGISKDEFYLEVDKFDGTLEELYHHIENEYGRPISTRSIPELVMRIINGK